MLDNYARAIQKSDPFVTSLEMAIAGTIGCLLVGLPLAYFLATRAGKNKSVYILLLVVPFWTSFLIRTYAWLIILGPNLGLAGQLESLTGAESVQILGHAVRGAPRARVRLPAADGLPVVRDPRTHGPDPR